MPIAQWMQGPLFKAVHWKYSNLRAGDASMPCTYATPDWFAPHFTYELP
jgi:hypothetical protein